MPKEERASIRGGVTFQGEKVQVNWPRAIGYFGILGLATALEVIEPPIALFIGALPFIKLVEQSPVPHPIEEGAGVLVGAGQATGTSPEGTFQVSKPQTRRASRNGRARRTRAKAGAGAGAKSQKEE